MIGNAQAAMVALSADAIVNAKRGAMRDAIILMFLMFLMLLIHHPTPVSKTRMHHACA